MTRLLLFLIRVYQATLSKLLLGILGPVCRFEPSCSRYAAACIQNHGPLRGSLLSVKRLCRCHPFNPGGYDPPPPAPSKGPEGAPHPGAAALEAARQRTLKLRPSGQPQGE